MEQAAQDPLEEPAEGVRPEQEEGYEHPEPESHPEEPAEGSREDVV